MTISIFGRKTTPFILAKGLGLLFVLEEVDMMFSGCIKAVTWNVDGRVYGGRLVRKRMGCCQRFGREWRMLTGRTGSCEGSSLSNSVHREKEHGLEVLH